MLTELKIRGLKSFYTQDINLRQLNILSGMNNSGKSSIIQALLMAEKAYHNEASVLLEGLGSVSALRSNYSDQDIIIGIEDAKPSIFQLSLHSEEKSTPYTVEASKDFIFPEIIYVSANRFGPKPSVQIYNDHFRRKRMGINGENIFQFLEQFEDELVDEKIIHQNSRGSTVKYNIEGWLSVISPNIQFKFTIDHNSDSSYATFNEYRSTNVGFGLSYALPVIAALIIGTKIPNSLIVLENPEAHLHPRGQTEIARLISLCAMAGPQIIVETHSDHLFHGVRLAVKESPGLADQVQFHWLTLNKKMITEIESPNIDKNGRLDSWPKGFFDQFEINLSKLV